MHMTKNTVTPVKRLSQLQLSDKFSGVVAISPKEAAEALGINIGNRRKRPVLVGYFVTQILNGEWQEDHPQPICFSDAGRCIDGQHRLYAIAEAGIEVMANVACGVRDELREYIDTGVSRKLEDRVTFIEGDHNTNKIIAAIVTFWFYYCGAAAATTTRRKCTPQQAMDLWTAHKKSITWVSTIVSHHVKGITKTSVRVPLAQMYERDEHRAIEFASSLVRPDGDIQQSRMLRDWLLRNGQASGAVAANDCMLRSISCMRAYLENREIRQVRCGTWE